MPPIAIKKKPAPVVPEPVAQIPQPPKREIIYDKVDSSVCDGPDAITEEVMKTILGWETEKDYAIRMIAEKPNLTPEECKFEEGDYIEDLEGNKVKMWNNDMNRPFYKETALGYCQTFLGLGWAGPTSMPGLMEDGLPATVNGEPLIVGRTGIVVSGQHRGAGFIFACQKWRSEKEKYRWRENWPTAPVFETILTTGVSESVRVVQTVDNVRPRSLTDVMYVAGIFKCDIPAKTRVEQRECSRMLDYAITLLFERTGANKDTGTKYQTHGASAHFLEAHPRLIECVRHLFDENKNRGISEAKMSPGQCAGMLYLMAVSESDGDIYRNADPPMEKLLKFDLWDEAKQFWLEFAANKEGTKGREVRQAVGWLAEEDDPGKSGRLIEKMCVIAKAWSLWKEPVAEVTFENIDPEGMYEIKDGVNHLVDLTDFGGIDIGPPKKKEKEAPTPKPEQIEEAKLLERKRVADAQAAKIAAAKAKTNGTPPTPVTPKPKKMTIQQQNTEKARLADEAMAKTKKVPVPVSRGPKPLNRIK